MTNQTTDISRRKAAKVAGLGLIIMLIPAVFANYFVFSSLVVPEDAASTASNITASEGLFRAGIVSWLIVLILDVVVAWALYVFLKPVNKSISLLAAWFRLIYTAIGGITLLSLVFVLVLLSGAEYLTVFETSQLHALVMQFFNGYDYGFAIGMFFFFLHLGILGYLVYKSGSIPRILGVLLIVASFSYLTIGIGKLLIPNYPEIITTVASAPGAIGEIAFALWLLIKGSKTLEVKNQDKTSEE